MVSMETWTAEKMRDGATRYLREELGVVLLPRLRVVGWRRGGRRSGVGHAQAQVADETGRRRAQLLDALLDLQQCVQSLPGKFLQLTNTQL